MKTSHLAAIVLLSLAPVRAESPKLDAIPLRSIDGQETTLQPYAGKVLLVVNVASECGLTPQYAGLEWLWRKYRDQGLVVLGFPSNDFGQQEPGTEAEIKKFCSSRYEVTFPMFAKVHAVGPNQHPLFTALTGPGSPFPGDIQWNFSKFLIGKKGQLVARFDSELDPESADLTGAIEKALSGP